MEIKIKKINPDGHIRLESSGEIKEIVINEDFLYPEKESISVCFRGKNSSGILDFTSKEIERLFNSLKKRMHLIKGVKKLTFEK